MKTNTKVPKTPFFAAFSVGAVLFSAHAGGGFATGNQANTYYVGLGWTGIISAIAAMLLLTLTMREAMIMYNSRGLTSYKQLFETLYHPFDKIEWAFEVFFYIMVLMAVAAAISGAASVLLSSEEIAQSEKNLSLVQDIKSDADALIAMVENLLSITKIRDGTMPLNKQEEMLEEVAGDALLTIRRRFPDFPIALNLSEDILYLPMEPMLIKQVIVNLLENAIRHSGDREHIQLHLFRQDDWAVVEVRDRGRGISPEVSRAVQSGRQLTDNLSGDSSRGMGIGLSVCQSIIKAHDGFFAAGNDPEGGAVFRFGLPMEEIKDE